ncbi:MULTISPECIES: DUF1501 domain-containing protein [Rhodomicrobium]|uniref:DUF1501 domain-containing protein n=1 Tax=Rhodomicrobium TaxID=1068 RepID=UPI000B4C0AB4|nr:MULTISPECIES: DUF1501 domain-containing protein [Rhodomicrobium]
MIHTRRDILRFGLAGAATLVLPNAGFMDPAEAAALAEDPHFFVMIVLSGGADSSYMFDARPLSMTAAGKIQNYLGKDPDPWAGSNGIVSAATSLIKPLSPFKDRFSVMNGVVMTPSFDGHAQNMNFLFTGDPFGGDSFIPHLNLAETGREPDAVDAIIPAEREDNFTAHNHSGVIPLEPKVLRGLPERLRQLPPAHAGDPITEFVRSRLDAVAQGDGRLSGGASLMRTALDNSPNVHRKLAALSPNNPNDSTEKQAIALIAECFRLSLSRAAIYVLPEQFDVHAPDLAKGQPKLFSGAIDKVAALLHGLAETPYDAKRSMFDVTTVMLATEFGRTLRAPDMAIDATGTNHNQYSNSILMGGKGIRGGMVIGASDMADPNAPISKAHFAVDPVLEKTVGMPFDFKTMRPRTDLPEAFDVDDYLTIGSVVNTLYALFNVPTSYHRKMGRDKQTAPVLNKLLT